MSDGALWKRLAIGGVAGLAGTMALRMIRSAEQKWIPEGAAPIQDDPGRFLLQKAKRALPERARQRVPRKVESMGPKLLAMGYGMTFGALYAVARPETRRAILEGSLLGLITWAVGYLGWLPLTGLMPPVWKHKPKQVITPIAEHALYGVATVAGYRLLKERAHV